MANALYDFGREGFLGGDIDWDANDIRLIFIDEADDTIGGQPSGDQWGVCQQDQDSGGGRCRRCDGEHGDGRRV